MLRVSDVTPQNLANVLRTGKRTTAAWEYSEPFLREILDTFSAHSSLPTATFGEDEGQSNFVPKDNTKLQFINRAYMKLADHADDLRLAVNLWPTGVLWWGLYSWGSECPSSVARLCRRNRLDKIGWQLRTGPGVYVRVSGWQVGQYCALGREKQPNLIERYDTLQILADEVASDVIALYHYLQPHLLKFYGELGITPATPKQRKTRNTVAKPIRITGNGFGAALLQRAKVE